MLCLKDGRMISNPRSICRVRDSTGLVVNINIDMAGAHGAFQVKTKGIARKKRYIDDLKSFCHVSVWAIMHDRWVQQ